mmetsp:Transcript_43311/g.98543  ORF Transcript_43311/g.98543 Transcript_43311/m.98543 type:complete len:324 (-) Transcript_43311:377-1348(-)
MGKLHHCRHVLLLLLGVHVHRQGALPGGAPGLCGDRATVREVRDLDDLPHIRHPSVVHAQSPSHGSGRPALLLVRRLRVAPGRDDFVSRVHLGFGVGLAPPVVVRRPHDYEQDRHEGKRHHRLPEFDDIRRDEEEDDPEPDVCKERGECRDEEHRQAFDLAGVAVIERDHADARDHVQVEGSAPHHGPRPECSRVELHPEDFEDSQQDFGRGGTKSHEGEVCDGRVPDQNVDRVDDRLAVLHRGRPIRVRARAFHLTGAVSDGLDARHERVREHRHPQEAPQQPGDVQEGAEFLAPHVLVRNDREEERVPRRVGAAGHEAIQS